MSPAGQAAPTSWQRLTALVVRTGRVMARWAANQSWGRLMLLGLLALFAQHILTNHVLHWDDEPRQVHQKIGTQGARQSAVKGDDDNDDEVKIGLSGITVRSRHHDKATSGGVDHATQAPTGSGSALADGVAAGGPPAGASPAAGGSRAAGGDSAAAGATASARASTDDDGAGATAAGDDDDDFDLTLVSPQHRTLAGWAKDITESVVMLLIIYLIGAKVVLRQTAHSEARAVQAEASAAAAAADAGHEALKRQLAEAQLQTLQAQVEPHFLFNTLASVDYLIETDPPRASAMQKNLIEYLRAALPQMRTQGSLLGREADLSRAYLEILKVRMEDRLQVAVEIPDGLRSAEFPPMMLQSLVENAIRHGVEPKPEGGEVRVGARVADGGLEVTVADSGVGLAAGMPSATAGGGVGLANLRERLARLYGDAAAFSIEARPGGGTVATIRLPYRVSGAATPAPAPTTAAAAGPRAGTTSDAAAGTTVGSTASDAAGRAAGGAGSRT